MHSLNEDDILAQGKMLDRSYELTKQIKKQRAVPMRADAIVLVVGDRDADKVLDMALSIYRNNPAIFADRPTPKIPLRIAPGIAVGDESTKAGFSLTSHREEIISQALALTRQRLGIELTGNVTAERVNEALGIFRNTFIDIARANGVNPNNLAFNLPKSR